MVLFVSSLTIRAKNTPTKIRKRIDSIKHNIFAKIVEAIISPFPGEKTFEKLKYMKSNKPCVLLDEKVNDRPLGVT